MSRDPAMENSPKAKKIAKGDKVTNFKINSNKMIEQRPRSTGFKSFLNWFKKVESLQQNELQSESDSDVESSSSEEDSSASSTATVASFAFLPANKYKPYGDAAQPEKFFSPGPYTDTYLRLILDRNRRRVMEKNITLRKKYSLYTSGTLPINIDANENNIKTVEKHEGEDITTALYDTFSLPSLSKMRANELESYRSERKTASLKAHVKGKRKAPQPPTTQDFIRSYRKKRKAPPPPKQEVKKETITPLPSPEIHHKKMENKFSLTENHPKLTNVKNKDVENAPRPWYKRESKQKVKSPPESDKKKNKHEFPEVSFFRCSQLLDNIRNINGEKNEVEQKSEKRISRYLPNISELDREAAEIIKQHKSNNAKNGESNSPIWLNNKNKPSATRELITKFNALAAPIEKMPNFHQYTNNNNNEIRLTGELINMKSKNIPSQSPKLNEHVKLFKNATSDNAPVQQSNNNKSPLSRAPLSPKFPREGEISQSFKAEIFSALPGLSSTTDPETQANKPTEQDLEKLSYMEEKLKLKEILKEMKNSLPKRPKPQKTDAIKEIKEAPQKPIIQSEPVALQIIDVSKNLIKTPNVILHIKNGNNLKLADESKKIQSNNNKVSSFAQTNCVVVRTNEPSTINDDKVKIQKTVLYSNLAEAKSNRIESKTNDENNIKSNTNILLKKLEQAIADGDDVAAANLAKDLAMLKVSCLVTCSPNNNNKLVNLKRINVYIEDQFSHQGPLPLQILENATIGELKAKVEKELNIPMTTQRWIIGKQLADDDNELLSKYNQNNFETQLFLYVIALDKKTYSVEQSKFEKPKDVDPKNIETKQDVLPKPSTSKTIEENNQPPKILEPEISNSISKPPILDLSKSPSVIFIPPASSPALKNVTKNTWICTDCTLINSLHSPLCSACGKRPDPGEITKENNEKVSNPPTHYKQLLSLDNRDLVFNVEAFECPICFLNCEPLTGVTLRDCIHSFCRECLENTIKHSDEAELKCPYRDDNYSCESIIQEREIRALVDKNVYEKHLAKSVKLAENKIQNTFHCKTPDCKGWCIFDDNVNEFQCPACNKNNCLTCQVIHEDKNCKEYQEQIKSSNTPSKSEGQQTKNMLDEMVKKGDALACPSCQVIMMKKWGCDWVRCSMCKTEICWVTRGPRWGPSGKGDTSAGCQCGINGNKCHPKCNYCH